MVGRVQIILNPPYSMANQKAHHFIPGDVLSGKVVFSPKSGEKVESISVTLKGWLMSRTTQGNFKGTYHFDVLYHSKTLLQGPVKMAKGTAEYPFILDIPREFASPVPYTGYSKPSDLFPSHSGPMWPLPPTCEDAARLRDTYNDWKIIYSLVARADKGMISPKDEIPIIITTARSALNPAADQVRQDARDGFKQGYTLTNQGIPRALSKGESLKESMGHNPNNFRLNLSLLAVLYTPVILGQPFTIGFVLQTDTPEHDCRLPLPEFQLRDYNICFSSATNCAAPFAKSFLAAVAMSRVELLPKKRQVNCPLRLNEATWMQEALPSGFKSPPSFKNVLIERRYYFQIEANVSCLGRTTKLKMLLPFWLHSSRVQGQPAPVEVCIYG